MLYRCATWTLRPEGVKRLRIINCKILPRVAGFDRKGRTSHKTLSYREVLEITNCEDVETTICERQLWLAGALVQQHAWHPPKRIVFGQSAHEGPRRLANAPNTVGITSRRDCAHHRGSCTPGSMTEMVGLPCGGPKIRTIGSLLRRTWVMAPGSRESGGGVQGSVETGGKTPIRPSP